MTHQIGKNVLSYHDSVSTPGDVFVYQEGGSNIDLNTSLILNTSVTPLYFRFKYNLDRNIRHPKVDLTRVRTHDTDQTMLS